MKKLFVLLVSTLLIFSCKSDSLKMEEGVQYSGKLMDVMGGKLEANLKLDELKNSRNLYALGVMENLMGEIQIFNSVPFNSRRGSDKVEIDKTFRANAAMLVYAQVEEWQEIQIPKAILTLKQFEAYLDYTARNAGLDPSKPFPFLLEGYIRKLNWHIVNGGNAGAQTTHSDHMKSGLNGVTVEEKVEILGFYSKEHQGIFTHHNAKTHMHFKADTEKLAAHVDDLLLGEYMTLKLPKQ